MERKKKLHVNVGRSLPLMGGRYTKSNNANWIVDRPGEVGRMNMSWKLTNVVHRSFLRHMFLHPSKNIHGIFGGKQ